MGTVKDNKGFTLIELMITIAILSILLSGAAVTFPQWLRQYIRIEQTAEANRIMDQVFAGISGELKFSKNREYSDTGLSYVCDRRLCTFPLEQTGCTISYDVATGGVSIIGIPKLYGYIFDTSFYNGLNVEVELQEHLDADGDAYVLTRVRVKNEENESLVSAEREIRCYNK